MPKKAAIVKSCPKCVQNVAVASKACKCGHSFAKRSVRSSSRCGSGGGNNVATTADADDRRRTSRVRREKPNYYDSQEYDKKKKKKDRRVSETKKKKQSSLRIIPYILHNSMQGRPKQQLCQPELQPPKMESHKESTAARAKRRRLRKEQEDGGGDLCSK